MWHTFLRREPIAHDVAVGGERFRTRCGLGGDGWPEHSRLSSGRTFATRSVEPGDKVCSKCARVEAEDDEWRTRRIKEIMELRYPADGRKMGYAKIGERVGVCDERVRQLILKEERRRLALERGWQL